MIRNSANGVTVYAEPSPSDAFMIEIDQRLYRIASRKKAEALLWCLQQCLAEVDAKYPPGDRQ